MKLTGFGTIIICSTPVVFSVSSLGNSQTLILL